MTNDTPPQTDIPAADPAPAGPGEPVSGGEGAVASRKRWIAAAAAALGVALFAVPFLRGPAPSGTNPGAGATAAGPTCASKQGTANLDFTLTDANGTNVRLTDYKGKVVLLNFWATWCGPCKIEIPEFVDAYQRYRDKGLVILGVLSEDDPAPEELHTFMTRFKMNYPVLRENPHFASANGDLWALPTSFVIDRHGAICTKHTGAMSKEMLEGEIKGLL